MTGAAATLRFESPFGPLDITLSEGAVHRLEFGGGTPIPKAPPALSPLWSRVKAQLGEYFGGKRRTFDLPLDPDPQGTEYQRAIWKAIRGIPYGETITYGELAARAGRPLAARAAGNACGANRIAVIIPCHRVVASTGLGGFGGDLALKASLLKLEGGR